MTKMTILPVDGISSSANDAHAQVGPAEPVIQNMNLEVNEEP